MADFDDARLIELVREFSHLYDKRNKNFKNRLAVENAWKTISELLDIPAEMCEQRWHNIRHRFAKERRMVKTKPSGSAAYSTWQHYNACLFLDDVVIPRRTTGNIKPKVPTMDEGEEVSHNEGDTMPVIPVVTCGIASDVESSNYVDADTASDLMVVENGHASVVNQQKRRRLSTPQPSTSGAQQQEKTPADTPRSEKKKGNYVQQLSSSIETAFANLASFLQMPESEDEDTTFGKTVGYELKKIKNQKNKLLVKGKIMEIIADAVDE